MDYKLEIKQIVDFPRCRIYRDFIQTLIIDKSIRTNGSSFLFFYLILCSYANYRTSYRRIEGITYTVGPGEWICPLKDLQSWFRVKFQHQIITILNVFEEQNYISYTVMGKEKIVKFKILDWPADNTVLEYNFPCKKDVGFFFFPIEKVHQLIWENVQKWTYCLICGYMPFIMIRLSLVLIPGRSSTIATLLEIHLQITRLSVIVGGFQRLLFPDC